MAVEITRIVSVLALWPPATFLVAAMRISFARVTSAAPLHLH